MVWRVRAATIGVTRMHWAMIMALGVNNRPRVPSGPARDSMR